MAQAATMGPPLSPREPRRSGRRPTVSSTPTTGSTSKSPDFVVPPEPPLRLKDPPQRSVAAASIPAARPKRPRQDDLDDPHDDPHPRTGPAPNGTHGSAPQNGRAKRKSKEKERTAILAEALIDAGLLTPNGEVPNETTEDEEGGVTRCICGSTGDDDSELHDFMVMCETCRVWQHGECMGYANQDQLADLDYYCELCRPDLHKSLLDKRKQKRSRQTSGNAHTVPPRSTSHSSRSRSPHQHLKPTKRRNTMNSRDAAFDESIQEIIEATAAEAAAAAVYDTPGVKSANGTSNGHHDAEDEADPRVNGRAKRKRTSDDDARSAKRTRSVSTVSDLPAVATSVREPTPVLPPVPKPALVAVPPEKKSRSNKRGGGRKAALVHEVLGTENDDVLPTPSSRKGSGGRAKQSGRRGAPPSLPTGGSAQDAHGTGSGRRGHQPNGLSTPTTSSAAARAYHHTHAYVVSQQQLFTSWHLPDYLIHLEHILPTDVPQPLEVRGAGAVAVALSASASGSGSASGAAAGQGDVGHESAERTTERGVKVKWPSKRMSVGDMNKRVRALVEWVGREQASALERTRRQDALERELTAVGSGSSTRTTGRSASGHAPVDSDAMVLDGVISDSPLQEKLVPAGLVAAAMARSDSGATASSGDGADAKKTTMKMMEELMEELIGFQERFSRSRS